MIELVTRGVSIFIIREINGLLLSIWWGMIFAFVYDTIRIFRRVVSHKTLISTCIEDIIFGIYMGIRGFIMFYEAEDGVIRGFLLAGLIIGAVLFNNTIGIYYIKFVSKPLKKCVSAFKMFFIKIKSRMEEKHAARIEKRKRTTS